MEAARPAAGGEEAQRVVSETPAATPAGSIAEPLLPPAAMAGSGFDRLSSRPKKERRKRGLSVHLTGRLRRLVPHSRSAQPGKLTLLKRIAWVALVIAFICLILWALAPRGFLFGHEPPAEWDYQQPTPALASHTAPTDRINPAAPSQPGTPGGLPETTKAASPNIPATPLAKHHGAIRMPLVHPIPSHATAGVPQRAKRHHRHLLGLGKLWHWVRHPRGNASDQTPQ
jgi:hypothetical protein